MADEVGTLKIRLEFDSKPLSGANGSKLGQSFGSAWSVAAGNLIAGGLAKIASAAVSVGKDILTAGMNYEKAMNEVKAISGATAAELENLSQKGIQSASTSVFTTSQVAEAYKYMGMAGWDAGQMIQGLDGILDLAAASNLDLGRTSDIVTDALTAFGYAASDSAHFADVLATASTNANTNVDLMGESFKYAGAIAGTLHYSIEDVGVALGVMANSGIKASQAGTSLRGMLTRMSNATGAAKKAMDELGLSMFDAQGNARPLSDVMVDLRQRFAGMTDEQKAQYATTIAGKNAMSGFLAIVNASEADFNKMTTALADADGAAKRMADTMKEGLAGAIAMVKSSWDAASASLYTGDFDGFVTQFGQAVDGLTGIIDRGAVAIADVLPKAMNEVGKRLPQLGTSFGRGLVKVVYAAIDGLAKMVPNLVTGLMNALASAWQEVANELPTLLPDVVAGIVDGILALTSPENLGNLIQAGLNMLVALADGLVNSLPVLIERLPILINNIVTVIIENLPAIILAGVKITIALINGIINALPQLAAMVPRIIITIVTTLVSHLPDILKAGVDILVTLVTGIASVFSNLRQKAHEIPETVVKKVQEMLPELLNKGAEMLNKLVEGIRSVWFNITQAAQDIWNTIVNKVSEIPGKVFEKGKEILASLVNGIKSVWSKVTRAAQDIFDTVVNKVKEIPGEMLNIGKNIVEGLWNGINGAVGWLKDKVTSFASSVLDSIKSAFGINSPSTVFRDIVGKNLAYGIGVGFDQAMGEVSKDMASTALDSLGFSPQMSVGASWSGDLAGMFDEYDGEVSLGDGVNIEKQVFNISNELDADDIGRRIMTSIRREA